MKKKGLMMIIKKYVVVFIILVMIGIKCEEIASDKKIIDSKNSTANKSKVKLRDASVTISEDNTNNDLLKENSVYINKYETSKENCLENCIECEEEKIVKTQVNNGTTNSYKKCKRCEENFLIFEGVCYDPSKLNKFVNDLKSFSPPKQQAVIEYVMNSEKNKLGQISKNNAQNSNSYPNELNFTQLSINTKKDLRNVKEELNKLKRISERKFRMNINELMNEFEQSIQTLLSLSNLFEQKTVYEIEKQKNSIIELLNNDNVDPQAKMSVVENRLQILKNSITNSFTMIRKNIENYETQSDKKIKNAQTSFLSRNNKFLY